MIHEVATIVILILVYCDGETQINKSIDANSHNQNFGVVNIAICIGRIVKTENLTKNLEQH